MFDSNNTSILRSAGGGVDPDNECCICYNSYQDPSSPDVCEKSFQLACGHIFGDRCIVKWLTVAAKCPLCRAPAQAPGVVDNSYRQTARVQRWRGDTPRHSEWADFTHDRPFRYTLREEALVPQVSTHRAPRPGGSRRRTLQSLGISRWSRRKGVTSRNAGTANSDIWLDLFNCTEGAVTQTRSPLFNAGVVHSSETPDQVEESSDTNFECLLDSHSKWMAEVFTEDGAAGNWDIFDYIL